MPRRLSWCGRCIVALLPPPPLPSLPPTIAVVVVVTVGIIIVVVVFFVAIVFSPLMSSALFDCCVLGGDSLPRVPSACCSTSASAVSTELKIAQDGAPPATVTGPARLRIVVGGRGARAEGGYQQDWMRGGVTIVAAAEKKVKYRCTMLCATHDILLKLHPG